MQVDTIKKVKEEEPRFVHWGKERVVYSDWGKKSDSNEVRSYGQEENML